MGPVILRDGLHFVGGVCPVEGDWFSSGIQRNCLYYFGVVVGGISMISGSFLCDFVLGRGVEVGVFPVILVVFVVIAAVPHLELIISSRQEQQI